MGQCVYTDNFTATVIGTDGTTQTPLTGANWQKQGIAWSSDVQSKFLAPTTPFNPANYYQFNTQGALLGRCWQKEGEWASCHHRHRDAYASGLYRVCVTHEQHQRWCVGT